LQQEGHGLGQLAGQELADETSEQPLLPPPFPLLGSERSAKRTGELLLGAGSDSVTGLWARPGRRRRELLAAHPAAALRVKAAQQGVMLGRQRDEWLVMARSRFESEERRGPPVDRFCRSGSLPPGRNARGSAVGIVSYIREC
jgi:hypothetical protein